MGDNDRQYRILQAHTSPLSAFVSHHASLRRPGDSVGLGEACLCEATEAIGLKGSRTEVGQPTNIDQPIVRRLEEGHRSNDHLRTFCPSPSSRGSQILDLRLDLCELLLPFGH